VADDLSVHTDVLGDYGSDLFTAGFTIGEPAKGLLREVGTTSIDAFRGTIGEGGVFAEGAVMMAAMEKQSFAFTSFLQDLALGYQAIGSVANVCAMTYMNTDIGSANEMNLLDFAFDSDPDAKRPEGLPDAFGETISDLRAGAAPVEPPAEALMNPDGGTTIPVGAGVYLTTYGDGSTRLVRNSVAADGAVQSITTVSSPAGVLLSTTTTTNKIVESRSVETRVVVTPGQDYTVKGKKVEGDTKQTTVTTVQEDGRRSVETTIETGGEEKKSQVTVEPGEAAKDEDEGVDYRLKELTEDHRLDSGGIRWQDGYLPAGS